MEEDDSFEIPPAHLYLEKQPDAVQWLPVPQINELKRLVLVGTWDYDTEKAQLELCQVSSEGTELEPSSYSEDSVSLQHLRTWTQPGRITGLQVMPSHDESQCIAVTSTSEGQVCTLTVGLRDNGAAFANGQASVLGTVHDGWIAGMHVRSDGQEVVTVGSDGKMCVSSLGHWKAAGVQVVVDSHGSLCFSSARWTSASEIVTGGGMGGSLLCWDRRQAGKAVSQSLPRPGISPDTRVLSIDVHSSRKHLCAVGCTGGEVLVWDLRFQQQPVEVFGRFKAGGFGRRGSGLLSSDPSILGGDVWAVRFDSLLQQLMAGGGLGALPVEAKLPAVMACSQDGVLALSGGGDSKALLREVYPINCFDIDSQFGQDVICGLDSECLVYFRRPRYKA